MSLQTLKMSSSSLLLLISSFAWCQDSRDETIDVQRLTDDIFPVQDEDLNYQELFENTVQMMSSPLDLNTTTDDELRALHILTDEQIRNVLAWRDEQGPLLDIYELQVVPGLDRAIILRLLPFVKVVDPSARLNKKLVQRILTSGNGYVVARYEQTLERKRGFDTSTGDSAAFTGSPGKIYVRMRSSLPGDFSIGVTCEKDEGERIRIDRRNGEWGFDFTSMHLQLKNKGMIRNLIAGDFQTQFAQGLLFGGAFGLGKGGEQISTVRKARMGFHPYTSVNESAFQRGMALTLDVVPSLDISLFYSRVGRDAAATGGDSSGIYSLQATGLHRSLTELSAMKKVKEQNAGIILHLKKNNLDVGIMADYFHFSSYLRKSRTLYNQFSFGDNSNVNTGVFVNYRVRNISFFSEAGRSVSGGVGAILGLLMSPHRDLEVAVLYRGYSRNFHTFHSNAFSENTQPQNEQGIYWAWKYSRSRRYSINGYVDLFRFPWLGFRRYKPSTGYEWLVRGNYRPSRDVYVFLQLREESKLSNLPGDMNVYKAGERIRRNVAVHFDYGLGKELRMKSRLAYSAQNFNASLMEGWAFVQDITWRISKFTVTARHSLFDTDHYDNRQYLFEQDMWSSYSMPAYSGIGVRNYALIEYNLSKTLTLWIRWSRTLMLFGGEIGKGQDAIAGNTRNDVKFQARFTF